MYYQPVQIRKKGEKLVLKKAMQQSKFLEWKAFNNNVASSWVKKIGSCKNLHIPDNPLRNCNPIDLCQPYKNGQGISFFIVSFKEQF